MTITRRIPLLALCSALAACGTQASDPAQVGASPSVTAVSLRMEQAERMLETGRDIDVARSTLTEILAEPGVEAAERDRATLGMSRVAELQGNTEEAIRLVEDVLALHGDGRPWPQEAKAEARLRKLLTGKATPSRAVRDRERWPVAPFAQTLTRFFPESASHEVTVRILRYGGSSEASDHLGTFNIGGAISESRRAECPLCEDQRPTHTLSSSGGWTSIPKTTAMAGEALEVFSFDLEEGRIPARYDARLPLPSAEIVARLERGEGLIAVALRGDNPPAILIAAPRWSQLADVEEELSKMAELPAAPVTVAVHAELRASEIQAAVRESFGRFRVCYEELLARSPHAAGKVTLDFTIQDGAVEKPAIDDASTLRDPAMDACMLAAIRALRFPRGPGQTTVKYPVAFSP